ncbi:hypothetical protein BDW59DRAFT_157924 [Aspergillus cavernicola]|uniref:Homeodomain-like protein n=1 Tax=Aspergillus cavernicola TaxID=176166 RepID=A0ABR4IUQ7_9EURO
MIRPRRNWTAEEDVVLKREVGRAQGEGDNISWHEIAAFLPGRTNKDCRKRWYGTAAAKVKKGPWTQAEDERLRRAIERYGTKWAVVASVVGSRLPDQCSKRWSHAINPEIDHSPWTPQEDALLIQNVNKHGHYWQQIVSLYLPGRTSLAAKNRYHILQRRLKSDSGGTLDSAYALERPVDVNSWQELLRWPENSQRGGVDAKGSSDQEVCSAPNTSNEPLLAAYDNTEYYMLDQGHTDWLSSTSHSPGYNSSGFDVESLAFPFPQVVGAENLGTSNDYAFPPAIDVDDFVFQTTVSPTRSSTSASPFSVSLLGSSSSPDSRTSSTQRKVCIQAVCSTDKLGAIFEAVTKFSVSAVIKTDD